MLILADRLDVSEKLQVEGSELEVNQLDNPSVFHSDAKSIHDFLLRVIQPIVGVMSRVSLLGEERANLPAKSPDEKLMFHVKHESDDGQPVLLCKGRSE